MELDTLLTESPDSFRCQGALPKTLRVILNLPRPSLNQVGILSRNCVLTSSAVSDAGEISWPSWRVPWCSQVSEHQKSLQRLVHTCVCGLPLIRDSMPLRVLT